MSRLHYIAIVLFTLIITVAQQSAYGQRPVQWIKAGTSIPYQFALQYEWQTANGFYLSAEAGTFSKPYRSLVFNYASSLSANPIVPEFIQATVSSGEVVGIRAGRTFGKNTQVQVGGYFQSIGMRGSRKPNSLQGKYFNVAPESLPTVSIQSNIYLAGIDLGYRFPISSKFAAHASISLGKAVSSDTKFQSSSEGFDALGQTFAIEADNRLQSQNIIPALNIFLAYRISGENTARHGNHHNRRAKRLLSKKALMDKGVSEIDW